MKAEAVLRVEAMNALIAALGEVDAERFICMVKRDTFDYTEWQKGLWHDKSLSEIHAMGVEYEKQIRKDTNKRLCCKGHGSCFFVDVRKRR